jgi:putative MATE family efflux protein
VGGGMLFIAQYFGAKDDDGINRSYGLTLTCMMTVGLLFGLMALCFPEAVMRMYTDKPHIQAIGVEYLRIAGFAYPLMVFSMAMAALLRCTGKVRLPLWGSIAGVLTNIFLNWVLIFGRLGFAPMGVFGAAVATVISRYVELTIVAFWTHTHKQKMPFIEGAFQSLRIPTALFFRIVRKGMPLLVNEALWSIGMTMLNQSYSTRGLDVVPALNISSTIYNLSGVVYMALGNAVGILIGQMLGANESEEKVRDADRKLIFASVVSCVLFGGLMAATSGLFPMLYDATNEVRSLATRLICISALMLPFNGYTNAAYFTLRSGGQTMVTFLFDSCFVWCFCVPLAYLLSRFTTIPILPLYFICQATDLIKTAIGAFMIKQGKWIQNLTSK